MRSNENCKIKFEDAETMYQTTRTLLPNEDGSMDHGLIIGAYLGWALDEIERLQADVEGLQEALVDSGKPISIKSREQAKRIKSLEAALIEPAKLMLTAEQREALELACEHFQCTHCPECEILLIRCDPKPAIDTIHAMLSGSVPAWEATEERKTVLENCIAGYGPGEKALREYDANVLRAMLTEAEP